jgi:hypothetical protein
MIKVLGNETVTTYSKEFYEVTYMNSGIGELKCKSRKTTIAHITPLHIETISTLNTSTLKIDVFTELHNAVKDNK